MAGSGRRHAVQRNLVEKKTIAKATVFFGKGKYSISSAFHRRILKFIVKRLNSGRELVMIVREALKNGTLSEERYLSWEKLTKENAWIEDSESYLKGKEKKFKEIARINKGRKNLKL